MFNTNFEADLRELNRQRLARRVTQSILRVQSFAHDAQRFRVALERVTSELQRLYLLNRELMLVNAKRKGGYFLIWLALLACCLLDFTLLSSVAEYFARRVYSDTAMVMLVRIVIPVAIVSIEMLISCQRAFAQDYRSEFGEKKRSRTWKVFTLGLLIFLPAMLIATQLVTLPETVTQFWLTVSFVQLVGLVALAVVTHGVVLFGGNLAVEAKAYLYLKFCLRRLMSREKRLGDRLHTATLELTQAYVLYISQARELVMEFPNSHVEPARFDSTTRSLLSETYGGNLPSFTTSGRQSKAEVVET
jgi:hypothetical protein